MEKRLTFGSVCDGVGCGHLAFKREGYDCQWSAEIEPFPCAVLKERFPGVRNVGTMMKVRGKLKESFIKAPDVFIGGTPCQAFSIAGKRKGLEDARGNLSLEFCRIADGIDAVRLAAGKDGCTILWENVPGVLSDKGNAFGCFLGQLSGEDEAIAVAKWPRAGVVHGRRRRVAWCVLDSQYFGVAQRRRRVFVIAVPNEVVERLGSRADPAEILSIGYSKRGDTPSRKDAGQGASEDAGGRAETGAKDAHGFNFEMYSGECGPVAPALQALRAKDTLCYEGGLVPDVANCLQTTSNDYSRADGFNMIVEPSQAIYENHANDSRITGPHDVSPMLTARMGTGGGNVHLVGPCMTIATEQQSQNIGDDVADSIGANDYKEPQAVCVPSAMAFTTEQTPKSSAELAMTLTKGSPSGGGQPQCVAISDVIHGDKACNGKGWNADGSAYTLDTMATQGVCFTQNTRDEVRLIGGDGGIAGCLSAAPGMKQQNYIAHSQVRRLLPTECEILQGLPVGWTAIPWRGKPATECPDGPRYKAIGNGQTVQVMQWLAMRIRDALTRKDTKG